MIRDAFDGVAVVVHCGGCAFCHDVAAAVVVVDVVAAAIVAAASCCSWSLLFTKL